MISFQNIPALREVIEPKVHDQQEYPIVIPDFPYRSNEETWTTFDGEQVLEPEIEEFLCSMCPDHLCHIQMLENGNEKK